MYLILKWFVCFLVIVFVEINSSEKIVISFVEKFII